MKLFVCDQGDRSVGIAPNRMEIILNWIIKDIDTEERDGLRKAFGEFAKDTLDFCYGRITVTFEDECADCHNILIITGLGVPVCLNHSCIASYRAYLENVKDIEEVKIIFCLWSKLMDELYKGESRHTAEDWTRGYPGEWIIEEEYNPKFDYKMLFEAWCEYDLGGVDWLKKLRQATK